MRKQLITGKDTRNYIVHFLIQGSLFDGDHILIIFISASSLQFELPQNFDATKELYNLNKLVLSSFVSISRPFLADTPIDRRLRSHADKPWSARKKHWVIEHFNLASPSLIP